MKVQNNNRKLIPSLVFNSLIVLTTIMGILIIWAIRQEGTSTLKYFTTLSNLVMGVVSFIYMLFLIDILKNKRNEIPKAMHIVKYCGTVLVAMTMIVVLFILLPGAAVVQPHAVWRALFNGSSTLFHFVTPILAIVTLLLFEHPNNKFKFNECLYGLILIGIYMVIYAVLALTHITEGKIQKGYDWYYFIQLFSKSMGITGASIFSIILVAGVGFLICWLTWLANKKINLNFNAWKKYQYKRMWAMMSNALIVILCAFALALRFAHDIDKYTGKYFTWRTLKYFTVQANIAMGIVALIYFIFQACNFKKEVLPLPLNVIKNGVTTCVFVTFVVILFGAMGAPVFKPGFNVLEFYKGANSILHCALPVVAVFTWLFLENGKKIPLKYLWHIAIYGGIYAFFYLMCALTHFDISGQPDPVYDWYHIVKINKWFACLIGLLAGPSLLLFNWVVNVLNNKIRVFKTELDFKIVSNKKNVIKMKA